MTQPTASPAPTRPATDMIEGALYLLAGGDVQRYISPPKMALTKRGKSLRFGNVAYAGMTLASTWRSPDEVTRRLTRQDVPWLLERQESYQAKGWSILVDEMRAAVTELTSD